MGAEKIRFTKEKETNLITLYGRAAQSRSARPILPDAWAEEAVGRIEYDFAKLKVGKTAGLLFASRARQLDAWTSDFLAKHPDAVVLHLGCGLDSRAFRIAPGPDAIWFDVDYPDVIEVRRSLYPERPDYRMIGSSLADLDWLREIPKDRPAWIVAEGVTMYLTEGIMKALLNALTDHFAGGGMAFDAHTPQMVEWFRKKNKDVRGTGATFHWGLGRPDDIRRLEPRLRCVDERRADRLEAFPSMPWNLRVLVRILSAFPATRMMRCLLYRF
jgi:O-methyltransferase involved in polyketide biosynthesis